MGPFMYVRFGSEADMSSRHPTVRFVPQPEVRDVFAWQSRTCPTLVRPSQTSHGVFVIGGAFQEPSRAAGPVEAHRSGRSPSTPLHEPGAPARGFRYPRKKTNHRRVGFQG